MTDQQRVLIAGVLVSSTLYLAACIAIGYLTGHPLAWKLAIASAGFSYLTYTAQLLALELGVPLWVSRALFYFAFLAGLFAGVSLL